MQQRLHKLRNSPELLPLSRIAARRAITYALNKCTHHLTLIKTPSVENIVKQSTTFSTYRQFFLSLGLIDINQHERNELSIQCFFLYYAGTKNIVNMNINMNPKMQNRKTNYTAER